MNQQLGWLEDATNERVLDAIRYEASPDYQRRIPEATQVGMQRVLELLDEFRPQWNEFEVSLVNKIGTTIARTASWENPMREFKTGMLTHGDTIEEIEVGLLRAYNMDPKRDYGEKALFERELPEVQTNYHRVNRQDMYKVTVNEQILKRAFLQDSGLSAFASKLVQAPIKSDNWDEFLLMTRTFHEYERKGGFFKVNVPDVSSPTSTEADAKVVLRRVREMADRLAFISTRYNAAHMPVFADVNDLVLFTTPEFKGAIDVNALAAAFNIERANVPTRIITVPKEHFNIDGAQAVLTTRDFFIVADQLMRMENQWNPVNLHMNYFWHHWQIVSASRFVPAVLFTTQPGSDVIEVVPTVDSIAAIASTDVDGETVTSVAPGMVYQFTPSITTTPADATDWWNLGIRMTLTGNTSARTHLSDSGVLTVSQTEEAENLTITAFDVNNEATTLEVVMPVAGENPAVWPNA